MGDSNNCGYQLRRIGSPKSLEAVQDVMRLQIGCNKFGRSYMNGADNEFFLDSCLMKYFISRRHAEIYAKRDGSCVLVDLGLNGTYVNDIRVDGKCMLNVDDRVTFGHSNGMKIKPGQTAPQIKSEFQFVFERADSLEATCVKQECENGESLCKIELKFDSLPLSDNQDNSQSRSECKLKEQELSENETLGNHRRNVPVTDQNNVPVPRQFNQPAAAVLLQTVPEEGDSKTVLRTSLEPPLPGPPQKNNSVVILEISDDSDSDSEEHLNNQATLPRSLEIPNKTVPKTSDSTADQEVYVVLNSGSVCGVELNKEHSIVNRGNCDHSKDDQERGASPVIPDQSSHTPILDKTQSVLGRNIQLTFSNEVSPMDLPSPGVDAGFVSDENSEEDSVNVPVPQIGSKRSQCQKRTQKKRGKRKKKSKVDSFQWYEVSKCASSRCKEPNAHRIGWVQCDRCDKWYHTSCVGCDYTKVKDEDIEFYCGCS